MIFADIIRNFIKSKFATLTFHKQFNWHRLLFTTSIFILISMTNKEKFLALVSKEKTDTLEQVKERIDNRAMLRESQKIALKVLLKLDELEWTQRELATKMGVSPQQISKIVSGKENLTIETQVKLQDILDIPILASYYENKSK